MMSSFVQALLRRCRVPIIAVAALSALSCREAPTGPQDPAEPAIRLESPVSGQVIGDTIVLLRGVAEAPGAVDLVEASYDSLDVLPATSITLYRYDQHFKPDGSVDSPTRVPFEARLPMRAGSTTVTIAMSYRLNRDDPIQGSTERRVSVSVPFQIWRKPTLRLERGAADTVYDRSLSLRVSVSGIDTARQLELVVDEGTPRERRAPNRGDYSDPIGPGQPGVDPASWTRVELPDTLGDGPHTFVLRLRDEMGLADSVRGAFFTRIASDPYTLVPLPGLGGTDAWASDVNAVGDVVGWAKDPSAQPHAVAWRGGAISVLPEPAGSTGSAANAVNERGDIAGMITGSRAQPVVWSGGVPRVIGVPGVDGCTAAMDVNDLGDVVIRCFYSSVIDRSGAQTVTGVADPRALNSRGQVVGLSGPGLNSGTFTAPTFGITIPPDAGFRHVTGRGPRYFATSINEASQALGSATTDYTGRTHFLFTGAGTPVTDLTTALGGPLAELTSEHITENGTVLAFDTRSHTAYRWRAGRTRRVVVTTPGWILDRVTSMNDAGEIVGHATSTSTGQTSAVRLRPTP
ncbi:MAG: hypothetical protein JWN79_1799 [Gemmatimonadetes bacterium]|jgi:hypothetical protein|nr:hypothetical protein [Gemmatimonadota bacterium]